MVEEPEVRARTDVPEGALPLPQELSPPTLSLKRFCEAMLELLHSEAAEVPVVSHVLSSLAPAITDGVRATATRLRDELSAWDSASEQIRRLAQSPLIQFGDEALALLEKLEQAQAQTLRVAELLEGLPNSKRIGRREDAPLGAVGGDVDLPAAAPPEICSGIAEGQSAVVEEAPPEWGPAIAVIAPAEKIAALYDEAKAHRKKKEYEAAEKLYTEILRLDRTFRLAFLHRGRVRLLQGRNEPAVEDLTDALRLGGNDPFAFWWRGDANLMCGRLEESIDDYNESLGLRSDLFVPRYNRAVAFRQVGNLERSLAELDQLARLKPGHGPVYLNRGLIYLARGNAARAAAEFRTALRYHVDAREATQLLAQAEAILEQERTQPPNEMIGKDRPRHSHSPDSPYSATISIESSTAASTQSILASTLDAVRTPSAPAKTTGRPTGKPDTAADCTLRFRCPQCRTAGTVRWDKLQIGKILACPSCRKTFTTRVDGRLAEVSKGKNGSWVDEEARAERRQIARSKRRRLVLGLAASALLVTTTFWSPSIVKSWAPSAEPELPSELEPRAKLFAQAWLDGDVRTMKRLTDPVQDRLLFVWYKKNPRPPGYSRQSAEQDVKTDVDITSRQHPRTALKVRFDGVPLGSGGAALQLSMTWEERGRTWFFCPDSGSRISFRPDRGRLDLGSRRVTGVFAAAAGQAADDANRHVLLANDLTAQANARQPPGRQHVAFRRRHAGRFAGDEFDPACGAARLPAAGVQLIDVSILLESQNQPLILRHFVLAHSLDSQFRHDCVPSRISESTALFSIRQFAHRGG